MKRKDLQLFRKKDLAELEKIAHQKKIELVKVKADIIASREKNLKKVKNIRYELSQILTLIKEAGLAKSEKELHKSEIKEKINKKIK